MKQVWNSAVANITKLYCCVSCVLGEIYQSVKYQKRQIKLCKHQTGSIFYIKRYNT
jgi:hypothetical protein